MTAERWAYWLILVPSTFVVGAAAYLALRRIKWIIEDRDPLQVGYVFLWTLAHRLLGRPEHLDLAVGAAFEACDSPEGAGTLCCGLAGRGYAALNLYRHTGDAVWLDRARDLGGVIVNDIPTYRIDHMPYGGVKDSGLGREGLRWSIEDMTELRIMVLAQPA